MPDVVTTFKIQTQDDLDQIIRRLERIDQLMRNMGRTSPLSPALSRDLGGIAEQARREIGSGKPGNAAAALETEYHNAVDSARRVVLGGAGPTRAPIKAALAQEVASAVPGDPALDLAAQYDAARQRQTLIRQYATAKRRGVDPMATETFRLQAQAQFGLNDSDLASGLAGLDAAAQAQGLLPGGGGTAGGGPTGAAGALTFRGARRMIRGAALYYGATQLQGLAQAQAQAAASGAGFRPEEHAAQVLGLAGLAAGSAFGPAGAVAGSLIGTGLGSISDAFFGARQQINTRILTQSVTGGFSAADLRAYGARLGSIRDPAGSFFWDSVGQQGALSALGALDPLRMAGATNRSIAGLADVFLKTKGPEGAAAIGSALSPLASDPLYSQHMLGAFKATNGLRAEHLLRTTLLDPSNLAAGVNQFGAGTMLSALHAVGLQSDRLDQRVIQMGRDFAKAQVGIGVAESGVGVAQARFQSVQSSGAFIDSPQSRDAQNAIVQGNQQLAQALQVRINQLRDLAKTDDTAKLQLTQYQQALARVTADTDAFRMAMRTQIAQTQGARLESVIGRAGLAAEREAFGLAPGAVAPSLGAQLTAMQARAAQATRQANDTSLPEEVRRAARDRAEQLRTDVLKVERQEDYQRLGVPLLVSQGYSARQLARTQQLAGFGASEESTAARLGSDILALGRTRGRAGDLLSFMEGHRDRYGVEDIERQRQVVFGLDQTIRQAQFERASNLAQGPIRRAGYVLSETTAGAGLLQSFGLGPETALSASASVVNQMGKSRAAMMRGATLLRAMGNDQGAEQLTSQANLLGIQQQQTSFDALTSFSFSNRTSLQFGQTGLAISLAEGNPFTGGMVPPQLRFQRIGQINRMLGQMNDRADRLPEGPIRDAFLARNFQTRAGLLQELQQQQVAVQFGEIGHAINVSFGAGGNGSIPFGTMSGLPSVAMYQQFVPNGLRMFGSSGAGVGLGEAATMALEGMGGDTSVSNPAQALSGLGAQTDQIVKALDTLVAAFTKASQQIGNQSPSGMPSARQSSGMDPRTQAGQSASGLRTTF